MNVGPRAGRGVVVSILGFFVVLLAVLLGVAVVYDLKSRHRHRRVPGGSGPGAGRAAQDRRSDARARPESIQGDAGMGGGVDF